MYGILVEYDAPGAGVPNLSGRFVCRMAMTRQVGYRRRLALATDCRQRAADLFLFASPQLARAALDSAELRASFCACAMVMDREPVLLISEQPWGEIALLRSISEPVGCERAHRDDRFTVSEPRAVLW